VVLGEAHLLSRAGRKEEAGSARQVAACVGTERDPPKVRADEGSAPKVLTARGAKNHARGQWTAGSGKIWSLKVSFTRVTREPRKDGDSHAGLSALLIQIPQKRFVPGVAPEWE
jgi:hypothetical protein